MLICRSYIPSAAETFLAAELDREATFKVKNDRAEHARLFLLKVNGLGLGYSPFVKSYEMAPKSCMNHMEDVKDW